MQVRSLGHEDTLEKEWQPTPLFLAKSHGRRSLVACSPRGCEESDMTEQLHLHFSLSCIGEGNGNPLQGSCLENPRDGRACWAAVYGVTQRRTRLKRLSSSSNTLQSHFPSYTFPLSAFGPNSSGKDSILTCTWFKPLFSCQFLREAFLTTPE